MPLLPFDVPMLKQTWKLTSETFRIWSEARSSQMAAALAFYSMLSLAPTLVIAIAIASYVFDGHLVEKQIVTTVSQVTTPEIAETIAGLIGRARRPESGFVAGSISIVVLMIGASGVFTQLYDTFNHIWHVDKPLHGFWFLLKKRLIGVVTVLVVGLLLIAALVLQSAIGYMDQFVEGYPTLLAWLNAVDRSLTFLLMPIVFSLMFCLFPATKIDLFDVIPAGLLTAFLVAGSRYFIQFYLTLSTASEVYGAMGSLVVMLVWIYILAVIIFFGASFGCAWSHTFGSRRPEMVAKNTRNEIAKLDREAAEEPIQPARRKPIQTAKPMPQTTGQKPHDHPKPPRSAHCDLPDSESPPSPPCPPPTSNEDD